MKSLSLQSLVFYYESILRSKLHNYVTVWGVQHNNTEHFKILINKILIIFLSAGQYHKIWNCFEY